MVDLGRGQEIRQRREALRPKVTQAELAIRAGVREQTVRAVEQGRGDRSVDKVLAALEQLEGSPPGGTPGTSADSSGRRVVEAAIGNDEVHDVRVRMVRGVRVVTFIARGRDVSDDELSAVIHELHRP